MKISNGFFVIKDAKKLEKGNVRLLGHFLSEVAVDVDTGGGSSGGSSGGIGKLPPIQIPPRLEVKWILPPKNSPMYGRIKAMAEGAGYETVEHDDFSYPGSFGK